MPLCFHLRPLRPSPVALPAPGFWPSHLGLYLSSCLPPRSFLSPACPSFCFLHTWSALALLSTPLPILRIWNFAGLLKPSFALLPSQSPRPAPTEFTVPTHPYWRKGAAISLPLTHTPEAQPITLSLKLQRRGSLGTEASPTPPAPALTHPQCGVSSPDSFPF